MKRRWSRWRISDRFLFDPFTGTENMYSYGNAFKYKHFDPKKPHQAEWIMSSIFKYLYGVSEKEYIYIKNGKEFSFSSIGTKNTQDIDKIIVTSKWENKRI